MSGLFSSINVAREALQVQRQGIEVTGHNVANVNTPGYARQRLDMVTATPTPGLVGLMGNGVMSAGVRQLRDLLLDAQVQTETSVGGFLAAQEKALQHGQAVLGQEIDRFATGAEATAAALGVGGQHALAERLTGLFAQFSRLTANPEDVVLRNDLLQSAQDLASEFKRVDAGLGNLSAGLDADLQSGVDRINELVDSIAKLNLKIFQMENGTGTANDLRDLRQQRIEELSSLVNLETVRNANGTVDVLVSGETLVSGTTRVDTLETYPGASGSGLLIRTQAGGVPLALTGGAIQGTIAAREGALAVLRQDLNELASALITSVNGAHRSGFSLDGTTGADFFTGTDASDIAVNSVLALNPRSLQASGVAGEVGNNEVARELSDLGNQKLVNGQTFLGRYGNLVGRFGSAITSLGDQVADQRLVDEMLQRQRDSIMGVSLDEEMTQMIKFQRAFEASAKLITTLDEMLATLVNMKR